MPTVFRHKGFRFLFYSNEGHPREPAHVHVLREGIDAKFWLHPEVTIASNDGYSAKTLRELIEIIEQNKQTILEAWNDFFG